MTRLFAATGPDPEVRRTVFRKQEGESQKASPIFLLNWSFRRTCAGQARSSEIRLHGLRGPNWLVMTPKLALLCRVNPAVLAGNPGGWKFTWLKKCVVAPKREKLSLGRCFFNLS